MRRPQWVRWVRKAWTMKFPSRGELERIATDILGPANRRLSSKTELRWGNHGSLIVNLDRGIWYDHENAVGGGIKDFIGRFQGGVSMPDRMEPEAVYPYHDESGAVAYEVVRYIPKTFRMRHRVGAETVWGRGNRARVPYRLPELIERSDEPIFIVEGEKDADRLNRLGVLATTSDGGASNWSARLNKWFADRNVIILPDHDEAGMKHAEDVCRQLDGVARTITVVSLAEASTGECQRGYDASDWIDDGGTRTALLDIADAAKPLVSGPGGKPDRLLPKGLDGSSLGDHVSDEYVRHRSAPGPDTRFKRFLSAGELMALPPQEWLISNIIERHGLAVLYGPPGVGKTFLGLDMVLSIANGVSWQGHGVSGASDILYVMNEGLGGLKGRITTWHWDAGLPLTSRAYFSLAGVDLSSLEDMENFVAAVNAVEEMSSLSLIVFDTLARSMSGDENSAQDVGAVVRSVDLLRNALGCAVLLIHHSGKDVARGMRGSNALLGAADSVLSMVSQEPDEEQEDEAAEGGIMVTIEKQRNAEYGKKLCFRQESVFLMQGGDLLDLDLPVSVVLRRIDC